MLRTFKVILTTVLGLLIIVVLVTAKSEHATVDEQGTQFALEVPVEGGLPGDSVPVDAASPAQELASARHVGGGMIPDPVDEATPLQRIAPLPQPTPPPLPKPPEPEKPKNFMRWRLVYNTVISAAGVFEQNGTSVVLPDIDVIAVGETCIAPNGVDWPCGMMARTAFRNFVKGRAITCKVPDVPPQNSYVAECRLHGRDMAEWLVDQGWARAKPSTLYVDKETAAKAGQRGIYGYPPVGVASASGVNEAQSPAPAATSTNP